MNGRRVGRVQLIPMLDWRVYLEALAGCHEMVRVTVHSQPPILLF